MTLWKSLATVLFIVFVFTASGCFYWQERYDRSGDHYVHPTREYHFHYSGGLY